MSYFYLNSRLPNANVTLLLQNLGEHRKCISKIKYCRHLLDYKWHCGLASYSSVFHTCHFETLWSQPLYHNSPVIQFTPHSEWHLTLKLSSSCWLCRQSEKDIAYTLPPERPHNSLPKAQADFVLKIPPLRGIYLHFLSLHKPLNSEGSHYFLLIFYRGRMVSM